MDKTEDMRRWAIEQVIAHHKGSGLTMDRIIAEAESLIAYVIKKPQAE
jgi:hypothetical protein